MRTFLNNEKHFYLKIYIFILCHLAMFSFLWSGEQTGKLLYLTFIGVTFTSLVWGLLPSLILSLSILFVLGTFLFFIEFQNIHEEINFIESFKMREFVIYGVILLLTNVLGGSVHRHYFTVVKERNSLRSDVEQFVAIDPDTSFDNAKRMEIEIAREMKRIDRHGGQFTILFLELDYYDEFLKVYGWKEVNHLLQQIGEKASGILRFSDKKFRFNHNKFAFLLIEMSKEHVEIVGDKLSTHLTDHKLLSGKTVTLQFHMSYEEYNDGMKETDSFDFIEEVERETVFYDL